MPWSSTSSAAGANRCGRSRGAKVSRRAMLPPRTHRSSGKHYLRCITKPPAVLISYGEAVRSGNSTCWRYMIHIVRKLIALALITAFSAGFTQPLVWCVSGSDHSRIEFKIGGNGHQIRTVELIRDQPGGGLVSNRTLAGSDCIDSEIFPEVVESATVDLAAKLVPAPNSLKWALPPPVRAPARLAHELFRPEPPSLHAATSQLDHIRTVVLLT